MGQWIYLSIIIWIYSNIQIFAPHWIRPMGWNIIFLALNSFLCTLMSSICQLQRYSHFLCLLFNTKINPLKSRIYSKFMWRITFFLAAQSSYRSQVVCPSVVRETFCEKVIFRVSNGNQNLPISNLCDRSDGRDSSDSSDSSDQQICSPKKYFPFFFFNKKKSFAKTQKLKL